MFLPKLNGVFSVIKPKGFTCTSLVNRVKRDLVKELELPEMMSKEIKLKHGVRLHDTAKGVVVLGLGKGINLLPAFIEIEKRYKCTVCLGTSTSNYFQTGKIIDEKPYKQINVEFLKEMLSEFLGHLNMHPPRKVSQISARQLENLVPDHNNEGTGTKHCVIHELSCVDVNLPNFTFDVLASGTFYITSFIQLICRELGSAGHIVDLERTQDGVFRTESSLAEFAWTADNIIKAIRYSERNHMKRLVDQVGHVKHKKRAKRREQNLETADMSVL